MKQISGRSMINNIFIYNAIFIDTERCTNHIPKGLMIYDYLPIYAPTISIDTEICTNDISR